MMSPSADPLPSKSLPSFGGSSPEPVASRRHTVRFVLIVSGIALAGLLNGRQPAVRPHGSHLFLYFSIAGLQLLFLWFIRLGLRARGVRLLDLLGERWRSPWDAARDFALALVFVFLLRTATPFLQHLLGQSAANISFLLPNGPAERVLWIAVSATAGICEEIVYRGYLQRQLWALSKNLPTALILQSLIFAAGHSYQGWRPAVVTGIYGLAFSLLAAWRKSIVPGVIAHTLIDILGGLVRR